MNASRKNREAWQTMAEKENAELWIVVEVMSGVPASVNAYGKYSQARRREKWLRQRMNPDYDEVGIFSVRVPNTKNSDV